MKEYFSALLFSSVAGGIAAALVGKPYEKYLRYLAALVCTALMVAPLAGVLPSLNLDLPETESSQLSYDPVAQQTKEDAETAVYNYIFAETGIKVKSLCIEIERTEGQLFFRSIRVTAEESQVETVRQCLKGLLHGAMEIEVSS